MKKIWNIILTVVISVSTVIGLYLYANRKTLFPPNPWELNYTKATKMASIVEKGVSPKGEKTFFITWGSRDCAACTTLNKTMHKYNKLAKGKTIKDGYIPYWTTDITLTEKENEAGVLFAYDYLLDQKYVYWNPSIEGGSFDTTSDFSTPTTLFIKDGKLKEIILGPTPKVEDITEYVKSKI